MELGPAPGPRAACFASERLGFPGRRPLRFRPLERSALAALVSGSGQKNSLYLGYGIWARKRARLRGKSQVIHGWSVFGPGLNSALYPLTPSKAARRPTVREKSRERSHFLPLRGPEGRDQDALLRSSLGVLSESVRLRTATRHSPSTGMTVDCGPTRPPPLPIKARKGGSFGHARSKFLRCNL